MADPSLASLYAGNPPPPVGLLSYTQEPTHDMLYNNSSEFIITKDHAVGDFFMPGPGVSMLTSSSHLIPTR